MAEGATISVLVADSSLMTAQLIAASLKRNRNPHIDVLLPAAFTSEGATRDIMQTRPDVALVSASLSDGPFAGYSVLRSLQQSAVRTRVILLLEDGERELIVERTKAGIAAARARGKSGGRPHKMTAAKLRLAMAAIYQVARSVHGRTRGADQRPGDGSSGGAPVFRLVRD